MVWADMDQENRDVSVKNLKVGEQGIIGVEMIAPSKPGTKFILP